MNTPRHRSCPLCASERIAWQLHRIGGRRMGNVRRELHWSCRACGHEWTDSALDGPEVTALPEISPTL